MPNANKTSNTARVPQKCDGLFYFSTYFRSRSQTSTNAFVESIIAQRFGIEEVATLCACYHCRTRRLVLSQMVASLRIGCCRSHSKHSTSFLLILHALQRCHRTIESRSSVPY